ncbi:putative beta-galactosidase B [Fusarium oxysporum]|nr:putative beta-galactosidase B [Fusarium oxysporum]
MAAPDDQGISSMKRSLDISETKAEIDADELRLAQMGHTQELNRHFSTLSLIGLASTTTISWTGLGLGLITEIGAGGPGAVIYGFILVTILQCFLGASLAEFVSSYPTEGGMYHWIAAVAPRRATGILSFLTGWFSVLGWIFTTASTNIIYAQILMALIALYVADLEIKAWQTFIVYQGLNLLTAGVVMFGNKIIPALNKFSLFYLQIGWLVVLVTVVACAPTHRDPEFVFRTWINTTGWNNPICFITGLVNPLFSLGGLDGVTHITEEMPNPSKNAPLAIAITLSIAFCTGITYLISLMFSIQDFDQLTSGNTGMPLAELFRQVTQKTGGAFGLLFILFIALGPCVVSSQLSTGRIFWAFSRDGAIPFSKVWSKVHPSLKIPFNSQLAVTAVIAALGCLYLGSSTAFNSLLGTAVTINNISYMFPILTNLLTGRKNMHKGVFHMGPTIGPIVNTVTVCWLTFAIIFFSFPYVMPVEVANMNYTCVVVGGLAILIGAWWLKAGKDFNGISLYEHWGWHAPNNETLDFETGAHDYEHAFDIAHELGLYVVYRPGPYSNAEANGGKFPGWLTTGECGPLRDDNAAYTKAWERYSKAVAEYVRPYLITNGGPVIMWQIENEYGNQWLDPETKKPKNTAIHYMELLEGKTRDWDIDVPFTANNPNMWTRSWSKDYGNVGGEVDMYGLDHYPACWTCNLAQCIGVNGVVKPYTVFDYYSHFKAVSPTQPSFLMEFQGGSFNPWDVPEGGCSENMGPDWVNLFYRHNLAEKVTAVNIYMAYGGINWGNIGFPEVGTSYDYSAPIHENRLIGDKFNEGKLFGLFVRVARDFVKVNRVGNSTDYTTDEDIFTSELRNADNNAAYYVVRHQDSTSTAETKFRLKVSTEAVVFWAPDGEQGEFLLKGATSAKFMSGKGDKKSFTKTKNGIVANVVAGEEMSVIDFSLVSGPYLVRSASIKGDTININGDWDEETTVEIWAPNTIRKVSFNGEKLQVTKSKYGSFIGTLPAPDITVESFTSSLPSLSHWKVSEGLPEVAADYDDSRWTGKQAEARNCQTRPNTDLADADHETTPHFVPPDTYPVLFADEYGYQAGNILWRGRFNATKGDEPTGAYLRVIGGLASGFSVYVNGKFLGAWLGSMTNKTGELAVSFQGVKFNTEEANILFVIQDTMGKEQREAAPDPRGILNATLVAADGSAANFTSWKVTGNAGANHLIDPVRGTYNEGGLHAERLGWHLPGYDDNKWKTGSPSYGSKGATARFYRTVVPLDVPKGYDASLSFTLHTEKKAKLRAQLYVNDYQYGKTLPYISNETTFPVVPGILNYQGDNTIGLNIWAMDEAGGSMGVNWKVDGVYRSGFSPLFNAEYLQPGWEDRSQCA